MQLAGETETVRLPAERDSYSFTGVEEVLGGLELSRHGTGTSADTTAAAKSSSEDSA